MKYYLTPTGIKQCRLTPEKLFRKLLLIRDDRQIPPQAMELFIRTIVHDNIVFRHPDYSRDRLIGVYGCRTIDTQQIEKIESLEHLADTAQAQGIVLMVSQTEILPKTEIGMNSMLCTLDGSTINPLFRKLFIDRALKTI